MPFRTDLAKRELRILTSVRSIVFADVTAGLIACPVVLALLARLQ